MAAILPSLLLSQVQSTAAWALTDERAGSHRAILENAPALDATYLKDPNAYLRVLLAAHFTTVATFVPTDVDSRIRHHCWWELETEDALLEALAIVDEAAAWDPSLVSARVVQNGAGAVAGHQGEWLSVWAGALGRALSLSATRARDHVVERIDTELAREERVFEAARKARDPKQILCASTVLAHNLGDLSRVVEAWPKTIDDQGLKARYMRLGHAGQGTFGLAGEINKPVMAPENDRFLQLRPARPLRKSRDLLLPIGPFFDAWGELIGKTPLLDEAERAEVVAALVETHLQRPTQLGCLRALAGIERTVRGGLAALEHEVPARLRKLLRGGAIREQIGVDRQRFEQRMAKRLEPFGIR